MLFASSYERAPSLLACDVPLVSAPTVSLTMLPTFWPSVASAGFQVKGVQRVDNLQADINLNTNGASLVSTNAGVAVSIQRVNLTIVDVKAQLELIVRLGHLVDIVNRVFQSLDLNPLLVTALNSVSSVLQPIVGQVGGLLCSVTQGGTTLSFLVDNLGNLVQEVTGANGSPVSSIVGDYLTNMTYTGASETLQSGLIEKTYSHSPLNALVNIVFNTAGQVVQATIVSRAEAARPLLAAAVAATTTTTPARVLDNIRKHGVQ
jgi:hypothetical protein